MTGSDVTGSDVTGSDVTGRDAVVAAAGPGGSGLPVWGARGVCVDYGKTVALSDVTLCAPAGQVTAVKRPNRLVALVHATSAVIPHLPRATSRPPGSTRSAAPACGG